MQKFGLQRNSSSQYRAIELEVVKEQASALGRAGRKLRLSLERYQSNQGTDSTLDISENLEISNTINLPNNLEMSDIVEISNNVWELMLQREFLGFTESNLSWVLANYVVPQQALDRLGLNIC
ncbi:MAG: hypothetical protein ACJA2E_001642 [Arenicella sp.]|jgi:hypothetical protein